MILALLTPCHDGMYHSNHVDLLYAAAQSRGFEYLKSEYESDVVRHRSKMTCHYLNEPRLAHTWGVLWVDADIGGRPQYLDWMRALPEDLDIVSGVYLKKNGRPDLTVRGLTEIRHPKDPDIVQAECAPGGFLRVSRRCLQAVYDTKHVPGCRDEWRLTHHARIMPSSLGLGYETEDYAFCLDAAALGFKTWVHRAMRLSHRGAKEFCA